MSDFSQEVPRPARFKVGSGDFAVTREALSSSVGTDSGGQCVSSCLSGASVSVALALSSGLVLLTEGTPGGSIHLLELF